MDILKSIFKYLNQNYSWIFSGIGVVVFLSFFNYVYTRILKKDLKLSRTNNDTYKSQGYFDCSLDKIIAEVEMMALPYPKWIGTTEHIYKSDIVLDLKKYDRREILKSLQKRLITKSAYEQKAPMLLIILGILEDELPNIPTPGMRQKEIMESVEYLRDIKIPEIVDFVTLITLLNSINSDCYA